MAIEIVNLPIKNGDVPWFFVCLPEGTTLIFQLIDGKHPMIFRVSTILLVQDFATIHISVISSQRSLHCLGGSHLTITTRPLDYVCIYTYIYIMFNNYIIYYNHICCTPSVSGSLCQGPGCEPALLLCLQLYFKNGLLVHPFFNWLVVEPQYVIPSTLFETPHKPW